MKKTVIITGSSRGIGAETAIEFARNGYENIVINYNNSKNEALKVLEKVRNFGCSAIALKADVSNKEEVEYLINETLNQFNKIDVLVNNAGIAQQKLFTDITHEEWEKMFDVNVGGMFNCTSLAVKNMIKNHSGKIINISSMWGITGASCEVHYSASKAAIIGFTKALAKELGPSGINVNCVAPGVIETDMNKNLSFEDVENLKYETPCQKIGTPLDVAKTIVFLASENASFITGQVIGVNGGFLI